mmetsp:Transcript_8807/g.31771  ORF Transcript_8807/g.31771 Transcript_8807/m.31771 type:complete len:214 (-) Transcript_8807:911-1552(-)
MISQRGPLQVDSCDFECRDLPEAFVLRPRVPVLPLELSDQLELRSLAGVPPGNETLHLAQLLVPGVHLARQPVHYVPRLGHLEVRLHQGLGQVEDLRPVKSRVGPLAPSRGGQGRPGVRAGEVGGPVRRGRGLWRREVRKREVPGEASARLDGGGAQPPLKGPHPVVDVAGRTKSTRAEGPAAASLARVVGLPPDVADLVHVGRRALPYDRVL